MTPRFGWSGTGKIGLLFITLGNTAGGAGLRGDCTKYAKFKRLLVIQVKMQRSPLETQCHNSKKPLKFPLYVIW